MASSDVSSSREASTASIPRGLSSICHLYGECICEGDPCTDAARARALDTSTRDRLAHVRRRLRECHRILHMEEAARRALAISGPQTGRERRRRQMAARWIDKQVRAVAVLAEEVETLDKEIGVDTAEGAQGDRLGCAVM